MTSMIERLWAELRTGAGDGQRRVDSIHPHDIYADYAAPDRLGLVIICATRPPTMTPLRSVELESGVRSDGRWTLHLVLTEASLLPVFAALCTDIVESTRAGVGAAALAGAVIVRIERWRTLLLRDRAGLEEIALRGLIAELHVLGEIVMRDFTAREAVLAWTGPRRTPQDFQLPSGARLEVKAVAPNAVHVRVNGLDQLDAGAHRLELVVVRMQTTGANAPGGVTASGLILRLRARLASDPVALTSFDDALAQAGWHEHPAHDAFTVDIVEVNLHDVVGAFPRLVAANAPAGVVDADYLIELPPAAVRTGLLP